MNTRTDTASKPGPIAYPTAQGGAPTAYPLTAFTDIRLIAGNSAAWRARRALIAQASQSIDLCYFIVETDPSSYALVQDLIAKANQGVKVRVLVDYLMTYPHAPLLRTLAQGNATIEVRRYGAPPAAWLQALTRGGVDANRFLEGLARQKPAMILEAIAPVAALPKSITDTLRKTLHRYEQGTLTFVLRVFEIFQEARNSLRALLDSATKNAGRADPKVPGLFERLKAKVEEVRRGVALVIEIVRGLEAFLYRTHHKLLLVDGSTFIMGGRNLSDAYQCDVLALGRAFRDVDVQALARGASAGAHAQAFEVLWQSSDSEQLHDPAALDAGGPALSAEKIEELSPKPDAVVAADAQGDVWPLPALDGYIVNNLPGKGGDTSITKAYTERIRAAAESGTGQAIDIVSAYTFFLDKEFGSPTLNELRDALADAVRAGSIVNIYTNSIDSTDLKAVNAAAYQTFAELIDCGVHVYELAPGQGSLHAKVAAIGDDWLMIGSFNMDPRSELYDTNNLIVFRDVGGMGTSALRDGFIRKLAWTPLSAQEARQLAQDKRLAVFNLPATQRLL